MPYGESRWKMELSSLLMTKDIHGSYTVENLEQIEGLISSYYTIHLLFVPQIKWWHYFGGLQRSADPWNNFKECKKLHKATSHDKDFLQLVLVEQPPLTVTMHRYDSEENITLQPILYLQFSRVCKTKESCSFTYWQICLMTNKWSKLWSLNEY